LRLLQSGSRLKPFSACSLSAQIAALEGDEGNPLARALPGLGRLMNR